MKATKEKHSSKIYHRVPNNPHADHQLTGGKDLDAKVIEREKKRTLYDASKASLTRFLETYRSKPTYYKTYAGHWKQRDEPDSDEQLRQSDAIQAKLKAQKTAAAGRERLKSKGAVPTRQGKKLFDEFMKEARSYQIHEESAVKDLEDLQQIYLAARALDDFDKWIYFIAEVL